MQESTPIQIVKTKSSRPDLSSPASLNRPVSPPPFNPRRPPTRQPNRDGTPTPKSATARVEAGEVDIEDHVSFFSTKLLAASRPQVGGEPRLSHADWLELYHRNLNDNGHHYVVHQHDHPIAETHYDLRLQCNATSSISFAIPYGLPGNPNSRRLNRNAIETRVHNLWNHLIETASHETGTMLLWDTGEYEVLPYVSSRKMTSTDDAMATEESDMDSDSELLGKRAAESEPDKLHRAFQNRKIKLRLHGTRLPNNYTLGIRLTADNNKATQPAAPAFKRRRRHGVTSGTSTPRKRRKSRPEDTETSSDSDGDSSPAMIQLNEDYNKSSTPATTITRLPSRESSPAGNSFDSAEQILERKGSLRLKRNVSSLLRTASPPPPRRTNSNTQTQGPSQRPSLPLGRSASVIESQTRSQSQSQRPNASDVQLSPTKPNPRDLDASTPVETLKDESTTIHQQNAYPGATNSINSIHQRKWFLSLDRQASGFHPTNDFAFGRRVWERRPVQQRQTRESQRGKSRLDEYKHEHELDKDSDDDTEHGPRLTGFAPFYVLGRDVETSILTGRLAAEVARDEGLVGYKPRGGWKGITE